MKHLLFLLGALSPLSAEAAVIVQTPGKISVDGTINAGLIAPGDVGDTLDYLTFEVRSTGTVTTTLEENSARQIWFAQYIGLDNQFDYILAPSGNSFLQYTFTKDVEGAAGFSLQLSPGTYVVAIGKRNRPEDDNQIYEIDYGYMAVNPRGGGSSGTYAFTVEGDIRGLEFRDGELNGTFIVTNLVPEPATFLLLALGTGHSLRRRRYPS